MILKNCSLTIYYENMFKLLISITNIHVENLVNWLVYGVQCHFQQYFSYISWRSVLLVEETRVPGEMH